MQVIHKVEEDVEDHNKVVEKALIKKLMRTTCRSFKLEQRSLDVMSRKMPKNVKLLKFVIRGLALEGLLNHSYR